jgi:uncharacterized protein YbjT (DUF2867 family)
MNRPAALLGALIAAALVPLTPFAAAATDTAPAMAPATASGPLLPAQTVAALRRAHILVIGGSGRNGSAIVAVLEAAGAHPVALTRDPEQARAKRGAHEWRRGDVTEPATLDAAFKGVDVVIDAAATRELEGPNGTEAVDREGVRNVVAAARRAGVKRILLITGMSVALPADNFPPMLQKAFAAKRESERILASGGVPYVILRPTGILDRPGGAFSVLLVDSAEYHATPEELRMRPGPPGEAERAALPPRGTIALQDLARVAAFAAVDPSAVNRAFVVTQTTAPARDDWAVQLAAVPPGTGR